MPADYKPHLKERANELFQDKWFKITYGTRVLGFILEADEACSIYIEQCETKYLQITQKLTNVWSIQMSGCLNNEDLSPF